MKFFYTLAILLSVFTVTAQPPTAPGSNFTFTAIEGNFFNLHWQNGNGARRIIVAKEGSPVAGTPQNGVDYAENTIFGTGATIAPGEFVVYDNVFTSFYLTGLKPSTHYYFSFFEYNGTGAAIQYLTTGVLTGDGATVTAPTVQTSNITPGNIAGNTITLNWQVGNGAKRLIVAREGSPVDAVPVDLENYGANAFGLGEQVGTSNYSVFANSGSSATVTGLKPNTHYYFSVHEFNGSNQPVYKFPGVAFDVTTLAALPVKLTSFTGTVTGRNVQLKWATESEVNFSHFNIQRSTDGITFNNIGQINGANATTAKHYNFLDDAVPATKIFYRLQMVDKDGSNEFSPVVNVSVSAPAASVRLLHNPAQDKFVALLPSNDIANEWRMINSNGQVVKQGKATNYRVEVAVNDLQAGVYFFQVNVNNALQSKGFIKQ